MAQGKEFTKEEKDSIVNSLQPYLQMGFSRNKACQFIGLTPQTLSLWVQADESLLIKLTSWENVVNTVAMQNVVDAINKENEMPEDIRKENSWKWLERRMRDDFATKVDSDVNQKTNVNISFDDSFNSGQDEIA